MAHVEAQGLPERSGGSARRDVAAGGAAAEVIASLGAVVLAILGLAGVLVLPFAAIATIAVGAALLFEGGTLAARLGARPMLAVESEQEIAGGLGAEALAGLAAIALGILALARIDPLVLLPTAAIVVGAGLLVGSAATGRAGAAPEPTSLAEAGARPMRDAAYAASGGQALVGLAAVVLGILALLGNAPLTLTLAAMLSLGGALILSGTVLGARIARALR